MKDKWKWEKKYIPHNTAIIYPVILDDRLELLVTFHDNTIKQFEVKINKEELIGKSNDFWQQFSDDGAIARAIANDKKYLDFAKELYKLLIKRITADLDERNIETLVIVPDKNLYRVPFAA